MKKLGSILAITSLLVVFLAVQSFATRAPEGPGAMGGTQQERAMQQDTMKTTGVTPMHETFRADQILGANLMNEQGENLGSINDLLFGSDGRIQYVVVSRGGILGIGAQLVPIPWQAVRPGTPEGEFFVNIERERFEEAPSFASGEWPDLADPQWERNIHAYYGEQAPAGQMERDLPGGQMQGTHPGHQEGEMDRQVFPKGTRPEGNMDKDRPEQNRGFDGATQPGTPGGTGMGK